MAVQLPTSRPSRPPPAVQPALVLWLADDGVDGLAVAVEAEHRAGGHDLAHGEAAGDIGDGHPGVTVTPRRPRRVANHSSFWPCSESASAEGSAMTPTRAGLQNLAGADGCQAVRAGRNS